MDHPRLRRSGRHPATMHACILADAPPKQRTSITYSLRSFQSTHNDYLRNPTRTPVHHCTSVQFAVRSGAQGIVRTDAATHGVETIGTSSRASFKPQDCIHAMMIASNHSIKGNKTPWRRFVCGAGQAPLPLTQPRPHGDHPGRNRLLRGPTDPVRHTSTLRQPPAPSVRKWALSG